MPFITSLRSAIDFVGGRLDEEGIEIGRFLTVVGDGGGTILF
jgi:hypothetical protein